MAKNKMKKEGYDAYFRGGNPHEEFGRWYVVREVNIGVELIEVLFASLNSDTGVTQQKGHDAQGRTYVSEHALDEWLSGWAIADAEEVERQRVEDERDSDTIRGCIEESETLEELKEAILEWYDRWRY